MKNIVNVLPISHSELEWNQPNKKMVLDLEIPQHPSIFQNKDKNLCESSIDLVCSSSSRPCSG